MSPHHNKVARFAELKNSTWLFLAQSTRIVGSVAGIMLVARYLGPSQYGMLAVALSISAIFLPIAHLGLQRVVLKEFSLKILDAGKVIKYSIILQIVGAVIATFLTYITCVILGISSEITVMCLILSSSYFFLSSEILSQFFLSQQKSYKTMIGVILGTVASLMFRIVAVFFSFTLVLFSATNIVQNITNLITNIFQYRIFARSESVGILKNSKNHTPNLRSTNILLLLLRQSFPLAIASLITAASANLDRLILERYFTFQDVGVYAVLMQILMLPKTAIAAYIAGMSPRMIAGYNDGLGAFSNRVKQGISEAFLLSLVILSILAISGEYLIGFIAGPAYEYPFEAFLILCLGVLIHVPSAMRVEFLLLQGKQKISLFINMGEAIVLSVSFIFLIPLYGILGAAYGYLISAIFSAILFNLVIPSLKPYAKIYFSAVLGGLTLQPIDRVIKAVIKGF